MPVMLNIDYCAALPISPVRLLQCVVPIPVTREPSFFMDSLSCTSRVYHYVLLSAQLDLPPSYNHLSISGTDYIICEKLCPLHRIAKTDICYGGRNNGQF